VTWYHSLPSLSTPRMPMWPLWWWPQLLMQPLMCRSMSPMSYSSSRSSKRSVSAAATGSSAHWPARRGRRRGRRSCRSAGRCSAWRSRLARGQPQRVQLASCTQGSSRFWSCVTRSSPWLKRSASSAAAVHLVGGHVARRHAGALERQRHRAVAGSGARARCAAASACRRGRRRRAAAGRGRGHGAARPAGAAKQAPRGRARPAE
jgi:hypothetical protein